MKCLPIHGEKMNIDLMCVVPLIVLIMRSTEHIKALLCPVFENVSISPICFMVEDI
jgi:hypothetical protein